MKKVFFIISVIAIFISCEKEIEKPDNYKGEVIYIKNGKSIIADCYLGFDSENSKYFFSTILKNELGYIREKLLVREINHLKSSMQLDTINSSFYTRIADGDVLQSSYNLDTTANNYFIIDTFNESTGDVSGRFQLTMVLDEWYDWETQPEYDTIHFTQGQFETRINYLK